MTLSKSYSASGGEARRRGGCYLKEKQDMSLTLVTITPLVALIAGVLILIMPRLLNYIVAFYLIAIGVLGLVQHIK